MKHSTYDAIIITLRKLHPRTAHQTLCSIYSGVSETTIHAIIYQECQKKTKKLFWMHHKPENVSDYFSRYLHLANLNSQPGFLLELAHQVDFSPSLMSRLILEQFYMKKNDGIMPSKKLIGNLLKDTSLIDDPILAVEVHLCTVNDDVYGPFTDSIRLAVGLQYEEKLKASLRALEIDYVDEDILRATGYDKTPDIKLQLPIAVDGHVVNWIESKASFGDDENHRSYLKEQYWSYWNRFGSGLVIYWCGFIEELDIHKDQGILLMDHFPKEITRMDPLSLMK